MSIVLPLYPCASSLPKSTRTYLAPQIFCDLLSAVVKRELLMYLPFNSYNQPDLTNSLYTSKYS